MPVFAEDVKLMFENKEHQPITRVLFLVNVLKVIGKDQQWQTKVEIKQKTI
jgi:hypothetical protein